jgi:SecD/SecF fusion protein
MRGKAILDIDFTGGTSVQLAFAEGSPHDIADVRKEVAELPDVAVSAVGENNLDFKIDTSEREIQKVQDFLKQKFGDSLRTYQMDYSDVAMIEAPAKDAAGGESKPAADKPDADKPAADQPKSDPASPSGPGTPAEEKPADAPASEAPVTEKPAAAPVESPAADAPAADKLSASRRQPRAVTVAVLGATTALSALVLTTDELAQPAADGEKPAAAAEESPAPPATESAAPPGKPSEKPADPAPSPPAADAPSKPAEPAAAASDTGSASAGPVDESLFAGGTRAKLKFPQSISYAPLREMIQKELDALHVKEAVFEISNPDYQFGSDAGYGDWLLETTLNRDQTDALLKRIHAQLAETPVFPSSNQIGGKVAGDTQLTALYALLASMLIIVVYVWIRFQNVIYGLAAVVALVHDVLITIAALAMSYYLSPYLGFLQVDPFKINLAVVAALLTIIGFSINDTIVIFDRIREVKAKSPLLSPEIVNLSINQTLSRTILTSGTVLIACIILYFVGGPGIHGFAFAMLIGVIAGTYSTVYIAAPILLWLQKPVAESPSRARVTSGTAGSLAKN